MWTEYYLPQGYCKIGDMDIYAKDSLNNEKFFVNEKNEQVYAQMKQGDEIVEYAPKDASGTEIFITNEYGNIRYPRSAEDYPLDEDLNPVYTHDIDGKPIFLTKLGYSFYGKNSKGIEIYPKDKDGKEIYLNMNGKEIPAMNLDGQQYYAKDQYGDEYYPQSLYEDRKKWRDDYVKYTEDIMLVE